MNQRLHVNPAVIAIVSVLLLIAGCSAQRTDGTITSVAKQRPSPVAPVGVIAIGHSGLTGENSDPHHAGQLALQNSWATGSSPQVDSVYERLVAQRPEERGHVANAAISGARVTSLAAQAQLALQSVPHPELVIVQTIDNDIRCDGTDADNVTTFGHVLQQTLQSINAASPKSRILLVGQLGRPSPTYVTQLVHVDPGAKIPLTGEGVCDFYDEHGALNPHSFTALTTIINSYEAEQARVCATVKNCRTDQGVRARWTDKTEYFTPDWNHLNVAGLAVEARVMWPVVADLLNLGGPKAATADSGRLTLAAAGQVSYQCQGTGTPQVLLKAGTESGGTTVPQCVYPPAGRAHPRMHL